MLNGKELSSKVLGGVPGERGFVELEGEECSLVEVVFTDNEGAKVHICDQSKNAIDAAYQFGLESGKKEERDRCVSICENEICNCCWGEDAKSFSSHITNLFRFE